MFSRVLRASRGDKTSEDKISEIQRVIFTAQQSALAAQASQLAMQQEITELKAKITDFETWDREKARYQLTDAFPGRGVFVHALISEAARGEPFHVLCHKCFEHRKRSILQATEELRMRRRVHVCHECGAEYAYGPIAPPDPPARAQMEYDPFKQ